MSAPPPAPALSVVGLKKRYGRRAPWALDGLSCAFPKGSLCGLVGPNGAGKTTLFSVICGFLPPDEGAVNLLGEGAFDPIRFKGRVGILPQDALLPERFNPRDFLRFMAMLQGHDDAQSRRYADEALESVDLTQKADDLIASLSHGMRRRLATASALLGRPELVLLDEPTAGLDPAQAKGLREQLLKRRGSSTIVVSSHNLDELERICDWVTFIDHGRCVREGTLDAMTRSGQPLRWLLGPGEAPLAALREALPEHSFSLSSQGDDQVLDHRVPDGEDPDAASLRVMALLAGAGVPLRELRRGRSLEESFMEGR